MDCPCCESDEETGKHRNGIEQRLIETEPFLFTGSGFFYFYRLNVGAVVILTCTCISRIHRTGIEPNKKAPTEKLDKCLYLLVRPEGFGPPTPGFEVRCSIQLSYERIFGMGWGYFIIPLRWGDKMKPFTTILPLFV